MKFTGERAIPWNKTQGAHILSAHIARYAWALPYVWGKKVVDLGCGTGYGTFMLSWAARRAIGVDISEEAIEFAGRHFEAPNLEYAILDITDRSYTGDIYCAFEVLEHLDKPELIIRDYRPLLWSIPIDDDSGFHKMVYSKPDIWDLVGPQSILWYQSGHGEIAKWDHCWFGPVYCGGLIV